MAPNLILLRPASATRRSAFQALLDALGLTAEQLLADTATLKLVLEVGMGQACLVTRAVCPQRIAFAPFRNAPGLATTSWSTTNSCRQNKPGRNCQH